jgi:hypothetical protein
MPTIWGSLDRVEEDLHGTRWVQVRTTLSGGTAIRVRVLIGGQTIVARGIERIDLSTLCAGEFVEVTYHHCHAGFMEAETIYVQPDRVPAAKGTDNR